VSNSKNTRTQRKPADHLITASGSSTWNDQVSNPFFSPGGHKIYH